MHVRPQARAWADERQDLRETASVVQLGRHPAPRPRRPDPPGHHRRRRPARPSPSLRGRPGLWCRRRWGRRQATGCGVSATLMDHLGPTGGPGRAGLDRDGGPARRAGHRSPGRRSGPGRYGPVANVPNGGKRLQSPAGTGPHRPGRPDHPHDRARAHVLEYRPRAAQTRRRRGAAGRIGDAQTLLAQIPEPEHRGRAGRQRRARSEARRSRRSTCLPAVGGPESGSRRPYDPQEDQRQRVAVGRPGWGCGPAATAGSSQLGVMARGVAMGARGSPRG